MKKMWLLLLVVMAAFVLTACQKEFAADGEYTAFTYEESHGGPQVTSVTVTIENDEIVGYYIDARQGHKVQTEGEDTPDDTSDDVFQGEWNELTKKELLEDYGMAAVAGGLEWYEQAEEIEAHWLANGVSMDDVIAEGEDNAGKTDAITGVSITVSEYYTLALEAIELARSGDFQAIYCVNGSHGAELYMASMTVEKGEFSDLVIDVVQSHVTDGEFDFNEKTKWELGFDYGMSAVTNGLEWFEQAEDIAEYVEANGWAAGDDLDGIASVSISTEDFVEVLDLLFDAAAPALD